MPEVFKSILCPVDFDPPSGAPPDLAAMLAQHGITRPRIDRTQGAASFAAQYLPLVVARVNGGATLKNRSRGVKVDGLTLLVGTTRIESPHLIAKSGQDPSISKAATLKQERARNVDYTISKSIRSRYSFAV